MLRNSRATTNGLLPLVPPPAPSAAASSSSAAAAAAPSASALASAVEDHFSRLEALGLPDQTGPPGRFTSVRASTAWVCFGRVCMRVPGVPSAPVFSLFRGRMKRARGLTRGVWRAVRACPCACCPCPCLAQVLHDVRLLLLRVAHRETLYEDCGGGSLASNLRLVAFQLKLADHLAAKVRHRWQHASASAGPRTTAARADGAGGEQTRLFCCCSSCRHLSPPRCASLGSPGGSFLVCSGSAWAPCKCTRRARRAPGRPRGPCQRRGGGQLELEQRE